MEEAAPSKKSAAVKSSKKKKKDSVVGASASSGASVVSADVESLKKEMEGLRHQMDFLQSLILAQIEMQQQQRDALGQSSDSPLLSEDELRKKRLMFYKEGQKEKHQKE